MGEIVLSPPVPLAEAHDLGEFRCGVDSLDAWLIRRARPNQIAGASRTYVAAAGVRVVGYYSLASGALTLADAPGPIRRNTPDPVPIALLARLAVDQTWHKRGLGVALLQDAVLRTMRAAEILGIRGLVVHAISDTARQFYEHHGFTASARQPMTLVLSLNRGAVPSPSCAS